MSDVQTLLTRCRELGAEFMPGPDGKLKVRAPAPLPAELREALKQRKAEVLAVLSKPYIPARGGKAAPLSNGVLPVVTAPPRQPTAWLCPHCGREATVTDVAPSRDGTYRLTFWHCLPCQVWAVTPSDLQEPPVWVSSKEQ